MDIAIVGAGISGLAAARSLARRHRVTVFEAASRIGGHTNTVSVPDDGRYLAVDTGFIVFNRPNYPNLCRLFDELGVASRDSDMSFSVSCERTGLEYNGSGFNALFAQRRNLVRAGHWRMLADILRFHRHAPRRLAPTLDDRETVSEFVRRHRYSEAFTERYLLPLGASLWSASGRQFSHFPVRFVIEFLHNHRMLQVDHRPRWKTVAGGSSTYLKPLTAPFRDRIHLSCPVRAVRRFGGLGGRKAGVEIELTSGTERFDEVVLACHADQARRLVHDADPLEADLLSYFPYGENEAVLHTDESFLPRTKAAWASWNYRIPADGQSLNRVSVTYNMNRLQGLESERTYCVTLNPQREPDPTKTIARFSYQHPLFKPGRHEAQRRHPDLIRRRGISYCGAYWGYGFHEDGLASGLRISDAYDLDLAA